MRSNQTWSLSALWIVFLTTSNCGFFSTGGTSADHDSVACGNRLRFNFGPSGQDIYICANGPLGTDPEVTKGLLKATTILARRDEQLKLEPDLDPKLAQELGQLKRSLVGGRIDVQTMETADLSAEKMYAELTRLAEDQEMALDRSLSKIAEMTRPGDSTPQHDLSLELTNIDKLYLRALDRHRDRARKLDTLLMASQLSAAETVAMRGRIRILQLKSSEASVYFDQAVKMVPKTAEDVRRQYQIELLRSLALTSSDSRVESIGLELLDGLKSIEPNAPYLPGAYVALFYAALPVLSPEYLFGSLPRDFPRFRPGLQKRLNEIAEGAKMIEHEKFTMSADIADLVRTQALYRFNATVESLGGTETEAREKLGIVKSDLSKALEANKKAFGNPSLQVAFTLVILATAENGTGDSEGFNAHMEEARQMGKTLLGPESLLEANALFVFGRERFHSATNMLEREKAVTEMESSLVISERILGAKHPSYGIIEINLAEAYAEMGNISQADKYYRRFFCNVSSVWTPGSTSLEMSYELGALRRQYMELLKSNGRHDEAKKIGRNGIECDSLN